MCFGFRDGQPFGSGCCWDAESEWDLALFHVAMLRDVDALR